MKKIAEKEKRTLYLFLIIFLSTAIIITLAGYLYYNNYQNQFKTEIENRLASIASLKVNQIVQWRKERFGDASLFYKNINFSELVKRFFDNPNDSDAKKRIQVWLEHIYSAYHYNRLCLHDNMGNEVFVFPDTSGLHALTFDKHISETIKSGKITFEDFYLNEHDKHVYLNISSPLFNPGNNKEVIGILAMRIDPAHYLYPLINEWPTPSKTAETLIVRREGNEVVFLNELRFQKGIPLNFRRPLTDLNLPAARATLGKKEIMEGKDYRGVPVIAYVCPIPNSPWFMVARMDTDEVYAPLREKLWFSILFVFVFLVGVGTTINMVWRNQRVQFYKDKSEAADALIISETRYRRLFEAARDGIIILDAETGMIVNVNPYLINLLGYSQELFLEKAIWDIGFFKDIVANKENFWELQQKEYIKYANLPLETAYGKKINVEFVSNVYLVDHRKVIQCNIRDITERKKTEDGLRESERKLREVQEMAHLGFWSWDIKTGDVEWSDEVFKIFSIDSKKFTPRIDSILALSPWPEDHQRDKELIKRAIETHSPGYYEQKFLRPDQSIGYYYSTFQGNYDEKDELISIVGTVLDITERKKADQEIQKLNQVLEQRVLERTVQLQNANKELESFSYSVSHDLRAPLRGIDGFANILLEDYYNKIDKEGQRLLNVIRENTQKMGHLIDDLLAFSRISGYELDKSEVNMEALANPIYFELTSEKDREKISFSVSDLPPIKGDAAMMRQLWSNLISNAIKFTSKKENPKIEIGFNCVEGNDIYFIRDNGVGFDMKYYGKLFGVFQRLHSEAEYKGTGVGLAIVKSIVTKHGGKIWAESELNVGTTIYFNI